MHALELIALWADEHRHDLAARTASEYERYLHDFAGHHPDPTTANTMDVRRWLARPSWSAGTRHYALRALKSFYK